MKIAVLSLHLRFPESHSLKAKRRLIKPLQNQLRRTFNVSAAEVGFQEAWQESLIVCALVSNAEDHATQSLQKIGLWLESHWPNIDLVDEHLEIIH